MPTVEFSLRDLQSLLGKKITLNELENLLNYTKGELVNFNDNIRINFEDTNAPYLWSVEGLARLLQGLIGKKYDFPKLNLSNSSYVINVESSVMKVRPYIGAFIAKGKKLNQHILNQLIQLQEKLCETYGRKREKISIGVYNVNKISFPVKYNAVGPNEVSFVPLDYNKKMNLRDILINHPKGKQYSKILENFEKYPILIDAEDNVLSFPPIINSNYSGHVNINDDNLMVEVTGNDEESIQLSLNIFAFLLQDRGFEIYQVKIKYPNKTVVFPKPFNQKIKIDNRLIKNMLGLSLNDKDIKKLLNKFRYKYEKGIIHVPDYRKDILHQVDIIEDIAIAYGYDNIKEQKLSSFTIGSTSSFIDFIDKSRELSIGLGFQEVMNPMLTNKTRLYQMMNIKDFGTIEIEEYISEMYSVVRTWLIPGLIELLSKNKHNEYPQKIFEQGTIVKKDAKDHERLALISCHLDANYTEMKQAVDFILRSLGFSYKIEENNHDSFIPGRIARIHIKDKAIGFIGEIHPEVLRNFGLELPVSAFEINLSELFDLKSK